MTTRASNKKRVDKAVAAQRRTGKIAIKPGRRASSLAKGDDSGFLKLLREVRERQQPVDVLLENREFQTQLGVICRSLTPTSTDADELFGDVCIKVWHSVPRFKPDYTHDYGNFFAWLRIVARRLVLANLRKPLEFSDVRMEDLADPALDIEASL